MKKFLRPLIICLLPLIASCEKSNDPSFYFSQASEAYENKDYDQSLIYLKTALKYDPSHASTRKLLGEVWLKKGDPKACIDQLQKALDLGMPHNQVILPLAQCLLYKNDYDQLNALNYSGNLLTVSTQDFAMLNALKAQSALRHGESSRALDFLEQAEVLMKDLSEVQFTKALWLAHRQQFEDALDILDKMLEDEPTYAKAWGLKGDIYRFEQKRVEAEGAYSKALLNADNKLDQRDYFLYRALTRVYMNHLDAAQEDLQSLKALKIGHVGSFYVEGLIALSKNDYPAAIENFQKVLSKDLKFDYAHYFAGLSYALNNNFNASRDHLIRFVHAHPNHDLGQKLLSIIEIKLKEPEQAKNRLLALAAKDLNDPDVYYWLGEIYLNEGHIKQGIAYLNKTLTLQPKNLGASMQVGLANVQLGDNDSARWAFDKILEQMPKNRFALLMKYATEYKAKHFQLARNLAKSYIKNYPKDPLGYDLEGVVYLREKRMRDALTSFHEALNVDPHDPNAHTQLAFLAMRDHGVESALQHYQKILEKHEHVPTLLRLAKIYFTDPNSQEMAIEYLERAIKQQPNQMAPYLALSRYYVSHHEYSKARRRLQAVPKSYSKQPEYLACEGLLYLAEQKPLLAEQNWQQIQPIALKSKQPSIVYELGARLSLAKHDWTALETLSHQLLKIQPQGNWLRLKATALWQQHEKSKAFALFEHWLSKHPEDDISRFWYANFLMEEKNYDKAALAYEALLERQPNNPIVYNNLAWILKDSKPAEAQKFALQALKLKPNWQSAKDTLKAIEDRRT